MGRRLNHIEARGFPAMSLLASSNVHLENGRTALASANRHSFPHRLSSSRSFHRKQELHQTAAAIHCGFPHYVAHPFKIVAGKLPHQVRSLPMASRRQFHPKLDEHIGRQSCAAAVIFAPRCVGNAMSQAHGTMATGRLGLIALINGRTCMGRCNRSGVCAGNEVFNGAASWTEPPRNRSGVSHKIKPSTELGRAKLCREKNKWAARDFSLLNILF
jgi:hypothetical protein